MMILSMDVIGDCAAERDKSGTRGHRQKPSGRQSQSEDPIKQHTRLAAQATGVAVERNESVQAPGSQQIAVLVQAHVAVAAPVSVGDERTRQRRQGRIPVVQLQDGLVLQDRPAIPGRSLAVIIP